MYLNGTPAAGSKTLYPEITVRTAAKAAALTSPGSGPFIILQTEISFSETPYVGALKVGSIELWSSCNLPGRNF